MYTTGLVTTAVASTKFSTKFSMSEVRAYMYPDSLHGEASTSYTVSHATSTKFSTKFSNIIIQDICKLWGIEYMYIVLEYYVSISYRGKIFLKK